MCSSGWKGVSRLEGRPTGRGSEGGVTLPVFPTCPAAAPDDSGQGLHLEPLPALGRPPLTSARGLCTLLPSRQSLPTSPHQRPRTPARWGPPQSSLPTRRRPGLAVSLCTPGAPAVVPPHASQRSPASCSGAPNPQIPIRPHSPQPHHTPRRRARCALPVRDRETSAQPPETSAQPPGAQSPCISVRPVR